MRLKRILFVPDCHVPYHDRRAWACMLAAAEGFDPDITVFSGDFIDFYQLSFHERALWRGKTAGHELKIGNRKIKQFKRATPNAKRRIITWGNHEERLWRFIANRCPELAGLIPSLADALGVADWEQIPFGRLGKLGKLWLSHEVGPSGVHTAHQSREAVGHNVVVGHCHRMGVSYGGLVTGEQMVGASFGWLGDRDKLAVAYAHQVGKRGWQTGFGVGYMDEEGNVWLVPVPIVNGRCVLEGKVYMGIEKCGPDSKKMKKAPPAKGGKAPPAKGKAPPAKGKKPNPFLGPKGAGTTKKPGAFGGE